MSILITRVATIALTHTGLSRQSARFQARSALTGAGFTTSESERVVNHPVRRRIILMLMLIGNAGIVGAVSSLILTFVNSEDSASLILRIVLLVSGLVMLWMIAMSQWVDHQLSRLIDWALLRYTRIDITDYASLMQLAGEYRIVELQVQPRDWLANKMLDELKLDQEGILVLGINRNDGTYLGVPHGATRIVEKNTLIAYGRISALNAIDRRRNDWRAGREHQVAISEHQKVVEQEKNTDTDRLP
jgi:hypothetical protein